MREISLGDGFGDVAVRVNGARIEVHADGSVDAYTSEAVRTHAPASDRAPADKQAYLDNLARMSVGESDNGARLPISEPKRPAVGDRMPDGTIYAGLSPDTDQPMYATPADAPLTYSFNQAQKYAAKLDAHGHHDWRVPTKSELNVLFQNCAAIGGFDESGSYPAGWYWSSSQSNDSYAWDQRFSDGNQYNGGKVGDSSLRCVR